MAKTYGLNDDGVVVIIGSGAGGGSLGHELATRGIDVVMLEAGARQTTETYVNDEWESFVQLAWLDPRTTAGEWRVAKDFPGLPAWICKTVGGSTTHWAGASLRFQDHEFRVATEYGEIEGANLLDWPITLEDMVPYYARAEDKLGVTRTHGIPGLPGNNNFKVMYAGAMKLGYQKLPHRPHGNQFARSRRSRPLPSARLLFSGLQDRCEMVDPLFRNPQGRGDREFRASPGMPGLEDPA